MSTLEKAYLKAMKIAEGEESPNTKALIEKATEMPTLQKRDHKEIRDSRAGISQMEQQELFTEEQLKNKGLIYGRMKNNVLLDRYRNLRTKLLSLSKEKNFITLVTSVVPESNSSIIAANLAATFALDEAKTSMLVESNLKSPVLNQIFEREDAEGLIDYLESEEKDGADILQKTGIKRLRFVPSGLPRENSAEYFTTDRMERFVNELVSRYPDRYPIFNAPSISDSADTRILIDLCDTVVLVVPYGKCSEEEVMQACIAIGEEKLAGVVLDNF